MVDNALAPMSASRPHLRHMFVGMVFALTASQIAISTAELFRGMSAIDDISTVWAPAAHLSLALIVLTASWVSWSATAAVAIPEQLEHVFQWPHVVLILDVVLVIIYYMIALSVEFAPSQTPQIVPSAMEETTLVVLIFAIYFLWDILHDVIMAGPPHPIRAVVVQTSASLVSFGLAMLVWWKYRALAVPDHGASVVFTDVALVSLLFGFRALKGLELTLNRALGADVKTKDRDHNWRVWLGVCGVVWILAVCAMDLFQPAQAKDIVPEAADRSSYPPLQPVTWLGRQGCTPEARDTASCWGA